MVICIFGDYDNGVFVLVGEELLLSFCGGVVVLMMIICFVFVFRNLVLINCIMWELFQQDEEGCWIWFGDVVRIVKNVLSSISSFDNECKFMLMGDFV